MAYSVYGHIMQNNIQQYTSTPMQFMMKYM